MNPSSARERGETVERNLGEQPLVRVMAEKGLTAKDLVEASPSPMTRKMVSRACKGRRLTRHSQEVVRRALEQAGGGELAIADLFTYQGT